MPYAHEVFMDVADDAKAIAERTVEASGLSFAELSGSRQKPLLRLGRDRHGATLTQGMMPWMRVVVRLEALGPGSCRVGLSVRWPKFDRLGFSLIAVLMYTLILGLSAGVWRAWWLQAKGEPDLTTLLAVGIGEPLFLAAMLAFTVHCGRVAPDFELARSQVTATLIKAARGDGE